RRVSRVCRDLAAQLLPYTTLFRSERRDAADGAVLRLGRGRAGAGHRAAPPLGALRGAEGPGHVLRLLAEPALTPVPRRWQPVRRSEEHTSELQSRFDLVCRLLLEK